jgi:flagellar motility protein MotE (MotC chaperone)
MEFRLRLMPVAVIATVGLLAVKLGDAWRVVDAPVATARAQTAPDNPEKPPAAPAAEAKPATKPAAPPAAAPTGADKPQAVDPLTMSPSEVELLQKLSERRAELDKRAAALSQREVLLQAAEKRIDEKIARLETLEKDIGGIVDKQSEEDQARIKSLVKIYETMKPAEAARILGQLDMPVLLGVVEHMKERNAAPILAAMDPSKAKTVTQALAERRSQREQAAGASDKPEPKPAAKP